MTKTEKESYKEPRIPNPNDVVGGKRRRESPDVDVDKQTEQNDQRTSNKLAKFTAPT